LATNWRSKKEIIDFNNQFFEEKTLNAEEQQIKDIYETVKQETPKNEKTGGGVFLSYLKKREEISIPPPRHSALDAESPANNKGIAGQTRNDEIVFDYTEFVFNEITEISPAFLESIGVKFLMIDLDNTLASYDEHHPSDEVLNWINVLKEHKITPAIISNSVRIKRVYTFAEAFDIRSVYKARKPFIKNMLQLMEAAGFTAEESAVAGDQIFTDVLAANRAKTTSIIVKPKKFTNVFFKIRYIIELSIRRYSKLTNDK
jgi:HAD superfamily phosphatase (TIGR01668 family)